MSLSIPFLFWVVLNKKAARVEVNISLAFLHWVRITVNRRRCEAELDGGRWADEAPRRECTTCGAPVSPSLVATSRSMTPSSSSPVPSHVDAARTHRRRGRVDDRALTPGSSASRCWRTDACFWRVVLRSMLLRMCCV